ncbi:hypothetical protein [Winogradskyella algicola]|uniref:hypothetical protein n=1 Tax=Winogradskyella algicola TaxID=2575815 RepID=UPI00110964F7|nr:hypothetical protein [Winogradskyella algicola]
MKTSLPFNTLDAYSKECTNLYAVVQSLFGYPSISENEIESLEGKLYAIAFTYICHDYLEVTIDQYPYDDFNELVNLMNFKSHEQEITKAAKGISQDPEDLETIYTKVWLLKLQYRKQISEDLKLCFRDSKTIGKFFSAIFKMKDSDYMPNLSLEEIGFIDDNF